jgi:hypothetical protein
MFTADLYDPLYNNSFFSDFKLGHISELRDSEEFGNLGANLSRVAVNGLSTGKYQIEIRYALDRQAKRC